MAKVYFPYLVAGYKRGKALVASKRAEDNVSDEILEALKRKALDHAAQAAGTTKDEIQAILEKALKEGWSIEELGRALRKKFGIMEKARSLLIARTELTSVINAGTDDTLREEGYTEKEWSTVTDGRERESHHAANGQTVSINGLFTVGGSQCAYPGDDRLPISESANCRCVVVSAGMPDDRKRAHVRSFLRAHSSLERKFVVALGRSFRAQRDRVLSHFPT